MPVDCTSALPACKASALGMVKQTTLFVKAATALFTEQRRIHW